MLYYVVKFENGSFLRTGRLCVHDMDAAAKYASRSAAKRAAVSSSFSDNAYEIISRETDKYVCRKRKKSSDHT